MKALFIELPAFTRSWRSYMDDASFQALQEAMMKNPYAGDVIEGTGGLRKLRFSDSLRQKGKRGGLRVIYFWWEQGRQFWLFTVYTKNEMGNLSAQQKHALKALIKHELETRK